MIMNLITGEGEASVPSTPDILIDLLFLPQAVAVVAAEQQTVVVERVDVVEDDDTKNNRPFRLQNQIKFTNDEIKVFLINIFTCWLTLIRLGRERSCKKTGGRLQLASRAIYLIFVNLNSIYY